MGYDGCGIMSTHAWIQQRRHNRGLDLSRAKCSQNAPMSKMDTNIGTSGCPLMSFCTGTGVLNCQYSELPIMRKFSDMSVGSRAVCEGRLLSLLVPHAWKTFWM